MLRLAAFFILTLLNVVNAFSPSVSVACAVGPSYTVTLTSSSSTGVIFIDGQCEAQSTASDGDFTFDAAACTTGTVPALGTEFKLVVQEYSTINLATDYIVKVTCTLDTSSVTQTVNLDATGEDYDTTDSTPTVSPTFSISFESSTGSTITSGAVGDSVQIVLSIPSAEASVFDFQVTSMTADVAGGDSVTIISAGCTQFSSILSQPSVQSGGDLTLSFTLFIPKDTSTSPALPGTTASTVTYTFSIEVCDSSCTSPSCSKRRRRSITSNNSTNEVVEVATSLVVYPPGHKSVTARPQPDKIIDEKSLCLSRSPLIGMLVALSITLAVCVGISAWMFCRLRGSIKKDNMSVYRNQAYRS